MFITFEGLDFSGKTTQAELLVERLRSLYPVRTNGQPLSQAEAAESQRLVRFLREPGGTGVSERIRSILLDRSSTALTPRAEILLFSASRTQLVSEVIAPALRHGEIVVCDRFYDSTTAYQGYGRGLDLTFVKNLNRIATFGIVPDLTLLIDIPVAEIERRKSAAGLGFDRMEESGRDFYERVRQGFLTIAQEEAFRFLVVDGLADRESIAQTIWRVVEQRVQNKQAATAFREDL